MLRSIFHCGTDHTLPCCCRIGASNLATWQPDVAYDPRGVPDDHDLIQEVQYWSTGFVIHEQVVATVAHAPRSPLVMGDRVVLPACNTGEKDEVYYPQRVLRVRRILDHPLASTQLGFDVRLLILHYDAGSASNLVRDEVRHRTGALIEMPPHTGKFKIFGYRSESASPGQTAFKRQMRCAELARDSENPDRHGHSPSEECVLAPKSSSRNGPALPSAEFGDSGAPVTIEWNGADRVAGMYVRRSTNRPVSDNPDLVVIRLHRQLREWARASLDRFDIDIPLESSETPHPVSAA